MDNIVKLYTKLRLASVEHKTKFLHYTKRNRQNLYNLASFIIISSIVLAAFFVVFRQPESNKSFNANTGKATSSGKDAVAQPDSDSTKPVASGTPSPASNNNYQQQADALRAEANKIDKCLAVDKAAYALFISANDIAETDFKARTKNVYNDPRLNLQQMQSIVNYNITKKNNSISAAFNTYTNSNVSQSCTPASTSWSYQPTAAGYPELTISYPYLIDYPYVSF